MDVDAPGKVSSEGALGLLGIAVLAVIHEPEQLPVLWCHFPSIVAVATVSCNSNGSQFHICDSLGFCIACLRRSAGVPTCSCMEKTL